MIIIMALSNNVEDAAMDKYQFDESLHRELESSCIPFAVYQFIDRRVVTLVLSEGFMGVFGFTDRDEAYDVMDHDMYRDAHPDDVSRIADAAFRFAVEEAPYNVVYRTRRPGESGYRIVHAFGKHVYTETKVRLAVVWYVDEGEYLPGAPKEGSELQGNFSSYLRGVTRFHVNYYDFLTGLPNMTYFFELADAGRKRIRSLGGETAFLFFDLVGMKLFNGKYGFAEGDRLLRAFARVLVKYFSVENCGRFGQDHYAVYTSTAHLEDVLEQLIRDCRSLNEGKSLPIRIGIYLDQADSVDIGTACDRAKMACDSKRGGFVSEYHYFDMTLLANTAKQHYILENFERALREGWIKVVYQPIVRASTGLICNEEALARWIDPLKGTLSPSEFVPILEDALLIYKLDLYMVDHVLADIKRKEEAGLSVLPVSVNLSRTDFECCELVEEICRRVDRAGVSRELLIIEITESTIGLNPDEMRRQISRLRELGFHVWLDDFGTGYSSLDVLQTFDIELIKFDLSFMQQFNRTEKSQIILTELMKMALMLGIDTVVEGVQTEEQVRFLNGIGSDKLQGDYYSRPIPLETVLERHRAGVGRAQEDAREAAYYTAIGTANLCDPGAIEACAGQAFRPYLQSLPMAILEMSGQTMRFLRFNESYVEFMRRCFGIELSSSYTVEMTENNPGTAFHSAIAECAAVEDWVSVREQLPSGITIRSLLRRVGVNPVTGAMAFAVIPLKSNE